MLYDFVNIFVNAKSVTFYYRVMRPSSVSSVCFVLKQENFKNFKKIMTHFIDTHWPYILNKTCERQEGVVSSDEGTEEQWF